MLISTCEPGTREVVLQSIRHWVVSKISSGVYSISGMAGLGKSTIVKTIAEWAVHPNHDHDGFFLATFFFSRREGAELRTASHVIPTLVYQLAKQHLGFRARVIELLDEDPDWVDSSLPKQAEIFATALEVLRGLETTPLVILDAFDECSLPGSVALLSLLLSLAFPQDRNVDPLPLKILVTSRPEAKLVSTFTNYCRREEYVLHDMDKAIGRGDIRHYLEQSMLRVPERFIPTLEPPLSSSWFTVADVEALTDRAGTFFIYAATAMRIIEDDNVREPELQLRSLLTIQSTDSLQYGALDNLYMSVIENILPKDCTNPDAVVRRYKEVVGTLVLLRDALPLKAVSSLLDIELQQISSALVPLHSLVTNPSDPDGSPTFYHASFYDFITSKRCKNVKLRLVLEEQERYLATRCLEILTRELRRNLGGIENPTASISKLGNIRKRISPEIRYSTCYWGLHLEKSVKYDANLISLINDFGSRCLAWWIELCGLLGRLDLAAECAQKAAVWMVRRIRAT